MRIGVIGLGFMGSTHLRAWQNVPDAQLAAVYSADEQKLTGDLSQVQGNLGGSTGKLDFNNVKKYRDIDGLLADREIDAVDICLPTYLHTPVAISALRAGKHVLVEKPMALTGELADSIIDEAKKSNRVLMAAQVLRFFPSYRALYDAIKSGEYGPTRSAFLRRRCAAPFWNQWLGDTSKSGGGVFDLLIHDVDMALHLFGMPRSLSSAGFENLTGGVDVITSEFQYDIVDSVTITGGWHHRGDYPFSMEYTVLADNGVVEFSSAGRPAAVYWKDGTHELLPSPDVDPYAAEIQYFVACARSGRTPDECPPEASAEAVKVAQMMVAARDRAYPGVTSRRE